MENEEVEKEIGFEEQFKEFKEQSDNQIRELKEKYEKELTERNNVIKQLLNNQKNEEEPQPKTEFDEHIEKTIEIVKKLRGLK